MNDWKTGGVQIERPEWEGNPADQRKALGKEETRERIALIEELLPNLRGDDLSLAHGTLAVLYGLLAGGSDAEPNHQRMIEHARAATELNCDLATPWRIMVEVHYSVDRTDMDLPTTYTDVSDRTFLCDNDLTAEDMAAARAETRRREARLLRAFDCAERAIALNPGDEANEKALWEVVEELKEVLNAKEALARAPAVGECIRGH